MPIRLLIWDFDGTIANSLPVVLEEINGNAKRFKYDPIRKEELPELRDLGAREILKKKHMNLLRLIPIVREVKKQLNSRMSEIKMQKGLKKVLGKGIIKSESVILTSNSKENVKEFLESNGIDFFGDIHESSIFGKASDLRSIIKRHHLKPEETAYIGDEVRDIDAAKAAKIKIISVAWGYNSEKALKRGKPDFLVKSPNGLQAAINNLQKP